jgi:NAD(P)-dependent dehydrogenase (short-subunit alcohol dehydrogenase family)
MKIGTNIFCLNGKRALVTGATGYLGCAMALNLAQAGAHVLVNSRSLKKASDLVSEINRLGYSAETAIFDVTNKKEIDVFVATNINKPLHILINNAYTGNSGSIEIATAYQYMDSYEIAVPAAHHLLKALLPNLRLAVSESGDASVINIASMYALVSPDQRLYDNVSAVNPPFYGAAKAALLSFTRYAACEFGHESIRVNSISPGPFPSKEVQMNDIGFIEKLSKKVPMGRVGQPEEIKGAVLFLASEASSFTNGANIVVDGGWTCW